MKTKLLAIAAGLLTVTACDGQTTDLPGDHSVVAFVVGSVSDPDGLPVAGATVELTLFRNSVCGGSASVRQPSVSTNNQGQYTAGLGVGLTDPFDGCVDVRIAPPTGSPLTAVERSGIALSFVYDGERPDTAIVSVTLLR
jgi:hypothetical protein